MLKSRHELSECNAAEVTLSPDIQANRLIYAIQRHYIISAICTQEVPNHDKILFDFSKIPVHAGSIKLWNTDDKKFPW